MFLLKDRLGASHPLGLISSKPVPIPTIGLPQQIEGKEMSDDKSPDLLKYFKYFEGKMAISGTTSLVTISSIPYVNDTIETVLVLLFIASLSCFLAGLVSKVATWWKKSGDDLAKMMVEKQELDEFADKVAKLDLLKAKRKKASTFLDKKLLDKEIAKLEKDVFKLSP